MLTFPLTKSPKGVPVESIGFIHEFNMQIQVSHSSYESSIVKIHKKLLIMNRAFV